MPNGDQDPKNNPSQENQNIAPNKDAQNEQTVSDVPKDEAVKEQQNKDEQSKQEEAKKEEEKKKSTPLYTPESKDNTEDVNKKAKKDEEEEKKSETLGALASAAQGLSPDVKALLETMDMVAKAFEELGDVIAEKTGIKQKLKSLQDQIVQKIVDGVKSIFQKNDKGMENSEMKEEEKQIKKEEKEQQQEQEEETQDEVKKKTPEANDGPGGVVEEQDEVANKTPGESQQQQTVEMESNPDLSQSKTASTIENSDIAGEEVNLSQDKKSSQQLDNMTPLSSTEGVPGKNNGQTQEVMAKNDETVNEQKQAQQQQQQPQQQQTSEVSNSPNAPVG